MVAGEVDDVGVHVDGGDVAVLTEQVCQQRRVIAGSGADFENAITALRAQLVEQEGDDAGLRGATQHLAFRASLGDHDVVRVGDGQLDIRDVVVAFDRAQRVFDGPAAGVPGLLDLGDQGFPQGFGRHVVGRGEVHQRLS